MATLKLLVLFVTYTSMYVTAIPQQEPEPRNTIFGDEKLEGGVFEHIDDSIFPEGIALFNEINPYRLPTTTRPIHYDVLWHIDIAGLTYFGTVDIDLVATQAGVNQIILHTDHTELTSVILREGNNVILSAHDVLENHHFLRINITNAVLDYNVDSPVTYRLSIVFTTTAMRDDMYGIYGSWFRNAPGDESLSWMATTQFQATAGRFAFPCYDEPSFKATFNIIIRRPISHSSWSCTRIGDTVPSDGVPGFEDDIYLQTPIMSTYLLAIIVAEYKSIPHLDDNGVLLYEVIARPAAIDLGQGDYAFNVGQELLAEMEDHTNYLFSAMSPNLKMTQAAIPDFGAGAMENWGLLTYREAYLMYDENHTSGYFKQMIAYILSHEIAHMWFGNLVTCDWWDVLWLNEGFARYYQYFLTHWVEDYMGLETRFITEQVHTSLLTDSANDPQPLTNPGVGSPQQVSNMFGTISYNKGAAVIRMTEHLLGFDVHREGLRNYLTEHQFSTALPIDLFRALQDAAVDAGALAEYPPDFSVIDYYRGWTERAGHPVLNVQVNHQTGQMLITQRRFNINTGYSNTNTNWMVPITFATASNPDFVNTKPTHIMRDSLAIINRGSIGDEWVIFNKQQTGFYRVNYDDYTWNLIVLALRGPERTLIHEYNRAQIVNDVFQFARSGMMTYTRAFNILSFLEFETEYAPWVAAVTGFNWMRNRLVGTPHGAQLEQMIGRWATRVMTQISYYHTTDESFMRSYLRYQLAPTMCAMGIPACRIAARAQFLALKNYNIEVFPDNRQFVYCNALRDGDREDYDFLWERFREHQVYTEKITLLQSLGCTPNEDSLNEFLTHIISPIEIIRPQDYTTAWNSAASGNEGNTQIVFQFIKNNMELVGNAFPSLVAPLSYVSSRLRTEEEVAEFQGWAYMYQEELGYVNQTVFHAAASALESIRWAASVESDLNNYFATGDVTIETSTAGNVPPVEIVTESQPQLIEPDTPDLSEYTDSAVSSTLTVLLIPLAVIVNVALRA